VNFSGDGNRSIAADLGGDRERKDPPDPGHRQQQRNVGVIGMTLLQAQVDLRDLAFQIVDQLDRGGDVGPPGLRDLQPRKEPAALDAEQVADRARLAEVDQGRVDAVLQRRLVLDQVQPEARELALLANARIG